MDISLAARFFAGEKHIALLIIAVGVTTFVVGLLYLVGFLGLRQPFHRGFGASVLLFSLLQLVGGIIYFRELANLEGPTLAAVSTTPVVAAASEVERLIPAANRLRVLKIVWSGLIGVGLVTLLLTQPRTLLHGLALGFVVQCVINLGVDTFAERREATYVQQLTQVQTAP